MPSKGSDCGDERSHGEVWGYHSQRMVRTERWKYVYNPCDVDELYDMQSDPMETQNLFDGEDPIARDLVAALDRWNPDRTQPKQRRWIPDDLREQLRSLGYIGE